MNQRPAPRFNQAVTLQPDQFERLRDLLARYGGIYLDRTSERVLTLGVGQRLAARSMTLESYLLHLTTTAGRSEIQQLVELILNHETIFFRNLSHMKALRQVVLPQLQRQKPPGEPLRIWSAGCSTGEEPYSLAIMALESLGQPLPRPVQVWATDLSTAALTRAQRATYRGRTLTNIDTDLYRPYFERVSDGWHVRDHVRALVDFEQLNLLEPFPPQAKGVDIIFCQNVTIYFQLETFRNLVARFYEALPEGGLLFLGFSETLWNVFDKFRLREIMGAFVYVKEPEARRAVSSRPAAPPPVEKLTPPPPHAATQRGLRPLHVRSEQPPAASPRSLRRTPTTPLDRSGRPQPARTPNDASVESEAIQRGRALLDAGQAAEALDLLYQLPLNGPHAPHALALIARAHANRGHADLALAEARRALELDTLTLEAYLLLGILYAQQGQLHEATQHLERARYLDPDAALISYHLAETYRQLQRHSLALREYRNTLRKLAAYPPDTILDGVAIGWLRTTCERYLEVLGNGAG
jgi:chemotaxis protein methyltransferase CheR